jgi:hypothetical protein
MAWNVGSYSQSNRDSCIIFCMEKSYVYEYL